MQHTSAVPLDYLVIFARTMIKMKKAQERLHVLKVGKAVWVSFPLSGRYSAWNSDLKTMGSEFLYLRPLRKRKKVTFRREILLNFYRGAKQSILTGNTTNMMVHQLSISDINPGVVKWLLNKYSLASPFQKSVRDTACLLPSRVCWWFVWTSSKLHDFMCFANAKQRS